MYVLRTAFKWREYIITTQTDRAAHVECRTSDSENRINHPFYELFTFQTGVVGWYNYPSLACSSLSIETRKMRGHDVGKVDDVFFCIPDLHCSVGVLSLLRRPLLDYFYKLLNGTATKLRNKPSKLWWFCQTSELRWLQNCWPKSHHCWETRVRSPYRGGDIFSILWICVNSENIHELHYNQLFRDRWILTTSLSFKEKGKRNSKLRLTKKVSFKSTLLFFINKGKIIVFFRSEDFL